MEYLLWPLIALAVVAGLCVAFWLILMIAKQQDPADARTYDYHKVINIYGHPSSGQLAHPEAKEVSVTKSTSRTVAGGANG